ncbi:MAG: hypothetical protein V4690_03875 [Patescibacteria group bacterium]
MLEAMMDNTFAKLLRDSKRVSGVRERTLKTEFNVSSVSTFNNWESGESFPKEDRIPLIARVYQVDENQLRQALEESKLAREEEKRVRRGLKSRNKVKISTEYDLYPYPAAVMPRSY